MKNNFIVFIVIISSCVTTVHAQIDTAERYIVISFEKSVNKFPQHGVQSFFWIVKDDSIKDKFFLLEPLLLDQLSKSNFDNCCKGGTIDPFVMTDQSNFNGYSSAKNTLLRKIIVDNKMKIQTVIKKWTENYIEQIVISATPIIGKFCSCILNANKNEDILYSGKAFIPLDSFDFDGSFWELKSSRYVKFADYSKLNFDIKPW